MIVMVIVVAVVVVDVRFRGKSPGMQTKVAGMGGCGSSKGRPCRACKERSHSEEWID